MEIKEFTPAQVLMLTNPVFVSGGELMKYSFLDLVYKGILKVYQEYRLPHHNSRRESLYTFVSRGDKFETYKNSIHQHPFIDPFSESDFEYQVRSLANIVYKDSTNGSGFKSKKVYKELKSTGYFSSSFGLKYVNLFFLNRNGADLKKKFKKILEEANIALPILIESNVNEAKNLLKTLGSNVLLLECFNDELIQRIKPIFNELGDAFYSPESGSSFDKFDAFELLFYSFIVTIDSFDNSFDSFDASFDFGSSDFSGSEYGGGDFGDVDF